MAEVRPALPGDFDLVHPLLAGFGNRAMSREDWRRMLFDLPWKVDEPSRGFVLVEGGRAVGFLGTIFSNREIAGRTWRLCNLSSWIVEPAHRSSSFQLVLPVMSMRSYTILNLSASPTAHEVFRSLGFMVLEDEQALVVPVGAIPRALSSRVSLELRPESIRAALDPAERRIFDDMRGTLAMQLLLTSGTRRCHIVATRSPWKGRMKLAHVQYASDGELLAGNLALVTWGFFRIAHTAGVRLDGRHAPLSLPAFAVRRRLPLPQLYRPADPDLTPRMLDGLYTESVGQRW